MRHDSDFDGPDLGKSGFRMRFSACLKPHVQPATTQAITTYMQRKLENSDMKGEYTT